MSANLPGTPPPYSDRGADAEGLHKDAQLDALADDMGVDLWETERDALSIHQLRALAGELGRLPGISTVLDLVGEHGRERATALVRGWLTREAEREVDKFGCDHAFVAQAEPVMAWFHDHYFRVAATGVENIPSTGRVLVVANHSGTLPYDAAMVVATARIRHPDHRLLRPLVENFVYHFPFLGMFMARAGAVRACQENAQMLLQEDEAVLVFPEGVKGIGKLFRKRYRLQRFGRAGAVRLALKTGSPIVPCAIVGAEEAMPLLSKMTWLAGPLGLPYIPITPTLPFLGPLGLLPFPTKWFIDFGEPIDVSRYGPDALGDRVLVNRLNEEVRSVVQRMIDARLAQRQSVFFG